MITYKITLENGESQTTQTGKDLYCSILDKFNIKYKIEEINSNDIPHSEIRRMESEGVYEEKFDKPNFSSYSKSTESWSTRYFNEEWNSTSTDKSIIPTYVEDDERMNIIGQNGNDGLHYKETKFPDWKDEILKKEFGGNNLDIDKVDDDEAYEDGVDERPIKKDKPYIDDEYDY